MSIITAAITAVGAYVPEFRLTNKILETMVDTNDAWIRERTGITKRHIAAETEVTSDLADKAAAKAMNEAGNATVNKTSPCSASRPRLPAST